jgi:phage-related protein (TIGR01555 family)
MIWPFNVFRKKKPALSPEMQQLVDTLTAERDSLLAVLAKNNEPKASVLGTTGFTTHASKQAKAEFIMSAAIPVTPAKLVDMTPGRVGMAMDSACVDTSSMTAAYRFSGAGGIPPHMLAWYANQAWIGYQAISVLLQHWLINRACSIPAFDATRNGWKFEGLEEEKVKRLEAFDRKRNIKSVVREQARYTRGFGIRIAMFKVNSNDPKYYEKPFNIDSVQPGTYQGISQIDQVWCSPVLDSRNVTDPTRIDFYCPDYWMIGSKKVHKSHLVITRYSEVPDILKPSYQYGGLSLPQLLWERVYAAERSANEGPQLLMTKRINIINTTLELIGADPEAIAARYQEISELRDNFGLMLMGSTDTYSQHETALSDVDTVIMTEYQLVAAVAEMPVTKLLGTTPKGFQSTGEHETDNYNVLLAGIQEHHCDPVLERHYQLAARHLWGEDVAVETVWNPLDEPTEKERADTQLVKAQTRQINQTLGNVSPEENRKVIANDPDSGYNLETTNGGEESEDAEFAAALHAGITSTAVQSAGAQALQANAPTQPGGNTSGSTQ